MSIKQFFAAHPVFTTADLVKYRGRSGSETRWTRKAILAQYRKQGRVVLARRGLYAVVPPGSNPQTFRPDPYLLAAKITDDAVLAYHTALGIHAKAHSVFEEFYFLSCKPPKPIQLNSQLFRGVLVPKALRDKGQEEYAVKIVDRSGLDVKVTGLERTLVDVLDRPDLGGGWEEIWQSLESVEFFDLDKVVEYVLLLDNATTAAKVGYYIDQHRQVLMADNQYLDRLKKLRPMQPHYLQRDKRRKGRLVSEWNLVVPDYLIDRAWEETG